MPANTPATRRAKGKDFERKIAKDLRESGLDKTARRMPCSGALEELKSDIITSLPIHLECKRQERVNLDEAYSQAQNGKKQQEISIVVSKKSRKPEMAYLKWSDLIHVMKLAQESGHFVGEYGYQKREQLKQI